MPEMIKLFVDPIWSIVVGVKDQVAHSLAGKDRNLIDATMIVASELLENAVKYGKRTEECPQVQFTMTTSDGEIFVEVSNGVEGLGDAKGVMKFIDRIKNSEEPEKLYHNRLRELWENPNSKKSQLGLYRIVCESKFQMDYQYQQNFLKITAKRALAN